LLKRFKVALRAAGVRDVRFHDLRHTFGTLMAAAGVPMRTLQEWLGHRDLTTTLIYADYAPSEREAEWVAVAFETTVARAKVPDEVGEESSVQDLGYEGVRARLCFRQVWRLMCRWMGRRQ
jgi:hypothetical protein